MSRDIPEDIIKNAVDYLTMDVTNKTFDELLNVLYENLNYKRLLKLSEKQFEDASDKITVEEKSQRSRQGFNNCRFLSGQIYDDVEQIVQERFQGDFLNKMKTDILNKILQFCQEDVKSSEIVSEVSTSTSQVKLAINRDKAEQINQLSSCNGQNICNIEKEASKIIKNEDGLSLERKLYDTSDIDITFDSVSSVHTSELSSFEDEISLSSDEEFGTKRRLSLKEVQEILEKISPEDMESNKSSKQAESIKSENTYSDCSANGIESSSISQRFQRRRKPNLKYISEYMESPYKRKVARKVPSSSRSVCGDLPRKRGRPRKHST